MSDPEIEDLIGAVAAKHGILLKPTDAAFALVTINQMLLERSGRELTAQIDVRLKEFEVSFERLQVRAGRLLAQELRDAAEELRAELGRRIDGGGASGRLEGTETRSAPFRWFTLGLAIGAVMAAVGLVWGLRV